MEPNTKRSFNKKFCLANIKRRSFLVSIDGSDTSEYALDLVANNFLASSDTLDALYIYNSKKDSKFNYKNKKEIIIPKYEIKIKSFDNGNTIYYRGQIF